MLMKKIKHYFFLAFLLSLICLNRSYALTLKNVYAFYNCPKTEISTEIKKFIDEKKYKLYKYDIENGFYYFQPRYMGTYTQGNYVLLGLKQISNDTFLYTQNNYASEIHRTRILNYLTQKGFTYAELKDEEMKNKLDSLANSFITDSYRGKKTVANTQLKMNENLPATENSEHQEKLEQLAKRYNKITQDEKILLALDLLKNSKQAFVIDSLLGNNKSQEPIKVSFLDLSTLGDRYKNYDGLGWQVNGYLYIFINQKHKDSPPEAIASLISGLEIHQDEYDSINEEVYARTREAMLWKELTDSNPSARLINYPLVERENHLFEMYKKGNYTNKYLYKFVSSCPKYKNLPLTSPDFESQKEIVNNAQAAEAKEKNEITDKNKIEADRKNSPEKIEKSSKTDASINNDGTNQKINQSQIIPEKLTEKDTKYYENVNRYAIDAFKNANFSLISSKYSSIDPNYEDVKKSIYLRHEKIVIDTYQIRKDKTALIYDLNNGKLKSIISISTNFFPNVSYHYKYPDGNLEKIDINLSPVLSFSFNEKGEYVNFVPYMENLQKKIKGNWKPNHPSNECSFHTLVLLKVNKKGELSSSKISKSSGNSDFDEEAMNAVKISAPFNPLPLFWGEDTIDIQFGFDMEQHRGYYYIKEFLKNNF